MQIAVDPTERLHVLAGSRRRGPDAVPQHVAAPASGPAAPAARSRPGLDADAEQAGLLLATVVGVRLEQLGHRRPALTAVADVLRSSRQIAHSRGRLVGVLVLHAAGATDPGRHHSVRPGRQEPLGDQLAHDGGRSPTQVVRLPVEQLRQGREDLVERQLAVAGADQRRLDGVDLARPSQCRCWRSTISSGSSAPGAPYVSWRRSARRPAVPPSRPRRRAAQRRDRGEVGRDLRPDGLLDVVGPLLEAHRGSHRLGPGAG